MTADAITADTVHQALRAIRAARSLAGSPLMQLNIVAHALREERLSDTPAGRASCLQSLLDGIVRAHLSAARGDAAGQGVQRPTADEALAVLRTDFVAGNVDREAWGVLWFQYLSGTHATLRDAAAALGLGYNTLRRRVERGYQLLADELRASENAAAAAVSHGRGVPRPLTRFIGREAEIAAVRALMVDHRLVTLTGAGGIGKSRLAIRLAEDLAADYPDGAVFVEIAALTDEHQVPQAVLLALGLHETPGKRITDTLIGFLAPRRLLLIVDNCEHLVAACSALIGELLRHARNLQVVATSREELCVDGAMPWVVPPLALPPGDAGLTAGDLMHFDAIRLFSARAAATTPGFAVTDANADRVRAISRTLEGIPLAIELAAARTRTLSLEQLDARLADRFAVLRDGRHAARPAHETLWSALEWSYDLLTEAEQHLLMRLAVFRGGWTIEMAEAVCAGDGIAERDVLALLDQLYAKSLVFRSSGDVAPRFGMLMTVQAYAQARLAQSSDAAVWHAAHLAHFVAHTRDVEASLGGADPSACLDRLDVERPNVGAALEWARENGKFDMGFQLIAQVSPYWNLRGEWIRGEQIAGDFLASDDPPTVSDHRSHVLLYAANFARGLGHYDEARRYAQEGVVLSRRLDRPVMVAEFLNMLAVFADDVCDWTTARTLYDEALTASRAAADRQLEGMILFNLGVTAGMLGDDSEAKRLIDACLAIDLERGDLQSLAQTLGELGNVYLRLDDREMARAKYQESLDIHRKLNARPMIAVALCQVGDLMNKEGCFLEALSVYTESAGLCREVGSQRGLLPALHGLGKAHLGLGAPASARMAFDEGLVIAETLDARSWVAAFVDALAWLAMNVNEPVRALRLLGSATVLYEAIGAAPLRLAEGGGDIAAVFQAASRALGELDAATAFSEGKALSNDAAIAYAHDHLTWEDGFAAVGASSTG